MEVCTPFGCLSRMAHDYPFAGLTVDGKVRQAKRFVEIFNEITKPKQVMSRIGDFAKRARLVTYEGIETVCALNFDSIIVTILVHF